MFIGYNNRFCGHCLKKFYKESPSAILDKSKWICASCRGICCCAACRRRKIRNGQQTANAQTNAINSNNTTTATANKTHKKQNNTRTSPHTNAHSRANNAAQHNNTHNTSTTPATTNNATVSSSTATTTTITSTSLTTSPKLTHTTTSTTSFYTSSPTLHSLSSPHFGVDHSFLMTSPQNNSLIFNDNYMLDNDQINIHNNDYTLDDIDNNNTSMFLYSDYESSDSDDDILDLGGTVPTTQFYNLLGTHIRQLANEACKLPNTPFGKLYRITQTPAIKRKISDVLCRNDIKKQNKVDMIANILLPHQNTAS